MAPFYSTRVDSEKAQSAVCYDPKQVFSEYAQNGDSDKGLAKFLSFPQFAHGGHFMQCSPGNTEFDPEYVDFGIPGTFSLATHHRVYHLKVMKERKSLLYYTFYKQSYQKIGV